MATITTTSGRDGISAVVRGSEPREERTSVVCKLAQAGTPSGGRDPSIWAVTSTKLRRWGGDGIGTRCLDRRTDDR